MVGIHLYKMSRPGTTGKVNWRWPGSGRREPASGWNCLMDVKLPFGSDKNVWELDARRSCAMSQRHYRFLCCCLENSEFCYVNFT